MRVCSCASAFFHGDRINALKSSLKQLQVQFDNQRILLQQKDEELRKCAALLHPIPNMATTQTVSDAEITNHVVVIV